MTSELPFFWKQKWIYLQVIHSSSSWCWNIFPHFEFQIKEKWERYPSNNNKKSKWKNQFKIRLTGLKERVQKMNELEEWETIYKEIVCNRITYFHFSHSLRFLFILAVKRYKKRDSFMWWRKKSREKIHCAHARDIEIF